MWGTLFWLRFFYKTKTQKRPKGPPKQTPLLILGYPVKPIANEVTPLKLTPDESRGGVPGIRGESDHSGRIAPRAPQTGPSASGSAAAARPPTALAEWDPTGLVSRETKRAPIIWVFFRLDHPKMVVSFLDSR